MRHRPSKPYVHDATTGIWSRPGYCETAGENGPKPSEPSLSAFLEQSQDRSVLSPEMKLLSSEPGVGFELSSARANICRPFEHALIGKRVLEIGASCGAITRYLGESAAEVIALEPDWTRAATACARVRDLDNVAVLAEPFGRFHARQRFDVITLADGLASASRHFAGNQPELTMLLRVRDLLAPGGLLILAADNPLALHTMGPTSTMRHGQSHPMGRQDAGPFSAPAPPHDRRQLETWLQQVQLEARRCFAPLPDHRSALAVISEEGLNHQGLDAVSLAAQSAGEAPMQPDARERWSDAVWPDLTRNGLALALGDSLLLTAQHAPPLSQDNRPLAWQFHTERQAAFCTVTTFCASADGGIEACSRPILQAVARPLAPGKLQQVISAPLQRPRGQNLHHEFLAVIGTTGWTDDDFRRIFGTYRQALARWTGQPLGQQPLSNVWIDGRLLDALPRHIVHDAQGQAHLLDTGWRWSEPFPASQLIFRAMLSLCTSRTPFCAHAHRVFRTRRDVLLALLDIVGIDIAAPSLAALLEAEAQRQHLVSGVPTDGAQLLATLASWPASPAGEQQLQADQEREFQRLQDHLEHVQLAQQQWQDQAHQAHLVSEERLDLLNQRLLLLDDRYKIIQNLKTTLVAQKQWIDVMESSRSWHITHPLRHINQLRNHLVEWLATESLHFPRTLPLHEMALERLMTALRLRLGLQPSPPRLCVCIHAFYPDLLASILERLRACTWPKKVIVTTPADLANSIRPRLDALPFETELLPLHNRGRDILPFLTAVRQVPSDALILKIHTKRSPHRPDGDTWRESMLSELLDPAQMQRTLQAFSHRPELGMVIPDGHALSVDKYVRHNEAWCHALEPRMPRMPWVQTNRLFAGGSMFYVRRKALQPIFGLGLTGEDFEAEAGQVDGTLAHALERLFGVAVANAGFQVSTTLDPFVPALAQSNLIHTR